MSETEIVIALEGGTSEEDVCIQFGVTLDEIDEIMEAYDYMRCAGCGSWWFKDEIRDEYCPECRFLGDKDTDDDPH